jgi:hypothetical protein
VLFFLLHYNFDLGSAPANNLSESMNAVLKREQDWKELPVDLLTLGLYYLQNLENYEILRGRSSIDIAISCLFRVVSDVTGSFSNKGFSFFKYSINKYLVFYRVISLSYNSRSKLKNLLPIWYTSCLSGHGF